MSLVDTGWRLSVGDGVSARTCTPGSTNVSWASRITCAVSFGRRSNGGESRATKPGREAVITYRPGGTSGNVTCPAPSVTVLAMTSPWSGSRSSTCTPPTWRVPSSVVIVATTRPARAAWPDWAALAASSGPAQAASRMTMAMQVAR
jgi:hypothetical protein